MPKFLLGVLLELSMMMIAFAGLIASLTSALYAAAYTGPGRPVLALVIAPAGFITFCVAAIGSVAYASRH